MLQVLAVDKTDVMPTRVEELLRKQAEDRLCKQAAETERPLVSWYDHYRYEFLAQKSALGEMLLRVVSKQMRAGDLCLTHYWRLARPSGCPRMNYILRLDCY